MFYFFPKTKDLNALARNFVIYFFFETSQAKLGHKTHNSKANHFSLNFIKVLKFHIFFFEFNN